MHNLEAIWKEYDQYENNISKILVWIFVSVFKPFYEGKSSFE